MTSILFAIAAAFALVSAAFFARFWRTSGDRFFLLFTLAFGVFAIQSMTVAVVDIHEHTPYHYALRLLAFLLILAAIVDKNRR